MFVVSLHSLERGVCSMYVLYIPLTPWRRWFSVMLIFYLFIQTVILSPSWQIGCESGSIVWDGSWHGCSNATAEAGRGRSAVPLAEPPPSLLPPMSPPLPVTAFFLCRFALTLHLFSFLIYSPVTPLPALTIVSSTEERCVFFCGRSVEEKYR